MVQRQREVVLIRVYTDTKSIYLYNQNPNYRSGFISQLFGQ